MPDKSEVYIAGVGFSPSPSGGSPANEVVASLISAATKALLDAGVTFDDVAQGVRSARGKTSIHESKAFKAFDEKGIPIDEVEGGSELDTSFSLIRDRGVQCVLMIAVEKGSAVAFVLVSDNFLWRHPYLKDSAALLRKPSAPGSNSEGKAKGSLYEICQMVWALRGWSRPQRTAGKQESSDHKEESNQSFKLSRVDAKAIPKWKDVEFKQDGKHRLGYNSAAETKDISQEDFEAVRATGQRQVKTEGRTQFKRMGGDRASLAKL